MYNGVYDPLRCGGGGTLTSGGLAASGGGQSGILGTGGNASATNGEGGGGGGYYGGGGGYGNGGGGGGNSWTDPNLTSNTFHTQGLKYGNGVLTLTWNAVACNSTNRVSVSILVTPIADAAMLQLHHLQLIVVPAPALVRTQQV